MLAACARPVTAAAPASTAADPINPLLDIISLLSILDSRVRQCVLTRGQWLRDFIGRVTPTPGDRSQQSGVCQPKIPLGLDGAYGCVQPLPGLGQQSEHIH